MQEKKKQRKNVSFFFKSRLLDMNIQASNLLVLDMGNTHDEQHFRSQADVT